MDNKKIYTAVGLMSGTSLDGLDAAILKTDGYSYVEPIAFQTQPYSSETKDQIRHCLGHADRTDTKIRAIEKHLTELNIDMVHKILATHNMSTTAIDVIGYHGQTIFHDAVARQTIQLGDGTLMAQETSIDVINDMRSADVQSGGHGAPLLPLYHRARIIADNIECPVAVLNIGGVANITYVDDQTVIAFDTGPGCALIDDFVYQRTGASFDKNGRLASTGTPNQNIVDAVLSLPYFKALPPKSLDRDSFKKPPALQGAGLFQALDHFSNSDGAATLTALTVQAIVKGLSHCPDRPKNILVTGGGRLNSFMMDSLSNACSIPVSKVETVGWHGDSMESEGFAYLAVRSLLNEPLSLPNTTGVPKPITGGVFHQAGQQKRKAV